MTRSAVAFVVVVLLVLLAGCSASPVAPSRVAPGPSVDARLMLAWDTARALPAGAWTAGRPVAAWLDSLPIVAIIVDDLPEGISANWTPSERVIRVNTAIADNPPAVLAAILIHEGRHAEGFGHTCGFKDATFSELGAWAVHALAMDALGLNSASLRALQFCRP